MCGFLWSWLVSTARKLSANLFAQCSSFVCSSTCCFSLLQDETRCEISDSSLVAPVFLGGGRRRHENSCSIFPDRCNRSTLSFWRNIQTRLHRHFVLRSRSSWQVGHARFGSAHSRLLCGLQHIACLIPLCVVKLISKHRKLPNSQAFP
jgi:hypothetical protein